MIVSAETLMSAAERLNRFFRIDMQKGGLVVDSTLQALETLEYQVQRAPPGELRDICKIVARDMRLDTTDHGGMVRVQTQIQFDTLEKTIRRLGGRQG